MAKISLNKLGEYMTAKGGRRRTIVADQAKPKQYISTMYNEARSAIQAYLLDGDKRALLAEATRLASDASGTPQKQMARAVCAEAIEAFADIDPTFGLADARLEAAPFRPPKLHIGGVDISVTPDILIRSQVRNRNYIGAVKLYFAKGESYQLQDDGAKYVATLLHEWCAVNCNNAEARPTLSLSVDVFRGRVIASPTSRKSRLVDIEACCEEIARAWPQPGTAPGQQS